MRRTPLTVPVLAAALALAVSGCASDDTDQAASEPTGTSTAVREAAVDKLDPALVATLNRVGVDANAVGTAADAGKLMTAPMKTADGTAAGDVYFWAGETGTNVLASLKLPAAGKTSTYHGFHVHANDDPATGNGCEADASKPADTHFGSADGHYAGTPGAEHGDHAGDLPPVLVRPDGTGEALAVTDRLDLDELAGKALIVHTGADNFNNVPTGTSPDDYKANSGEAGTKTGKTGNAGDREACGVVAAYATSK